MRAVLAVVLRWLHIAYIHTPVLMRFEMGPAIHISPKALTVLKNRASVVLFLLNSHKSSQSHVTTDDQSVSKSWLQGPAGSRDRTLISV
jgi:hypothetical protein